MAWHGLACTQPISRRTPYQANTAPPATAQQQPAPAARNVTQGYVRPLGPITDRCPSASCLALCSARCRNAAAVPGFLPFSHPPIFPSHQTQPPARHQTDTGQTPLQPDPRPQTQDPRSQDHLTDPSPQIQKATLPPYLTLPCLACPLRSPLPSASDKQIYFEAVRKLADLDADYEMVALMLSSLEPDPFKTYLLAAVPSATRF